MHGACSLGGLVAGKVLFSFETKAQLAQCWGRCRRHPGRDQGSRPPAGDSGLFQDVVVPGRRAAHAAPAAGGHAGRNAEGGPEGHAARGHLSHPEVHPGHRDAGESPGPGTSVCRNACHAALRRGGRKSRAWEWPAPSRRPAPRLWGGAHAGHLPVFRSCWSDQPPCALQSRSRRPGRPHSRASGSGSPFTKPGAGSSCGAY